MELQRLMEDSVATQGVFVRFAQLSDEDKKKVKDKVKKKLKEKGGKPKKEAPKGKKENGKKEKGKVPPQFKKKEEEVPEEKVEVEEEVQEETPEEEESVTEEEVPSEEAPSGEVPSEEGQDGGSIETIVDELKQEVELIQKDGQVTPSEVIGLFDNLMQMVQTLIESKHPKKTASVVGWDPNAMVDRIASDVVSGRREALYFLR